jgi:hypothetical protein
VAGHTPISESASCPRSPRTATASSVSMVSSTYTASNSICRKVRLSSRNMRLARSLSETRSTLRA